MEKITLPNGFRIILEPVDWARSATMGIWVGSGSRYETPQTAGVSHFIEHMLFKGTARRSALAIAEQMEDPKQAVGVVKREVVQVITPGTVVDSSKPDSANNFTL